MKLELGSGWSPHPDFDVHVDLNPSCPVEVVADISGALPFPDAMFDEIRAVDCLEHISYRDTGRVLTEWGRVLRPGGLMYVQVPDARTIMECFLRRPHELHVPAELESLPPIIRATWRLMGGQNDGDYTHEGDEWRWNAHYALFDVQSLSWYLTKAGFRVKSMDVNGFPNLLCWSVKV